MEKKKNGLKNFAIEFVRELFSPQTDDKSVDEVPVPVKKTLADLKIEDLTRERIRLDRKEQEFMQRIRKIGNEKKVLFEQGVRSSGDIEQTVVARRINELDKEAQSVNQMLKSISKQKQFVHTLTLTEERARLLSQSGLVSLGDIDLAELITHIEEISLNSDVQEKNIDNILGVLGKNEEFSPEINEDPGVLEIMNAMNRIREAAEDVNILDGQEIEKTLNEISSRKEENDGLELGEY